jgi:hypothetical protein
MPASLSFSDDADGRRVSYSGGRVSHASPLASFEGEVPESLGAAVDEVDALKPSAGEIGPVAVGLAVWVVSGVTPPSSTSRTGWVIVSVIGGRESRVEG